MKEEDIKQLEKELGIVAFRTQATPRVCEERSPTILMGNNFINFKRKFEINKDKITVLRQTVIINLYIPEKSFPGYKAAFQRIPYELSEAILGVCISKNTLHILPDSTEEYVKYHSFAKISSGKRKRRKKYLTIQIQVNLNHQVTGDRLPRILRNSEKNVTELMGAFIKKLKIKTS